MSHTRRRISARHEHEWVLHDLVTDPVAGYWAWVRISARSPEGRRRLARYRSDSAKVRRGPPQEFRRDFQKGMRQHNRQEVIRWSRHPDPEDYPVLPVVRHRHSALWAWW